MKLATYKEIQRLMKQDQKYEEKNMFINIDHQSKFLKKIVKKVKYFILLSKHCTLIKIKENWC